jgi:hypothetical protein
MLMNLADLIGRKGQFTGHGVNHEGQTFRGTLILAPILSSKGVSISFRAEGKDGTVYHEEQSVIGPTMNESLGLWVISNNHPAVIQHELSRVETLRDERGKTLIFGIGAPEARNTFREEIAMDLHENGDIGYRYFWGMPGGEFKERSGVRMIRF